jgi:hypothetical protein
MCSCPYVITPVLLQKLQGFPFELRSVAFEAHLLESPFSLLITHGPFLCDPETLKSIGNMCICAFLFTSDFFSLTQVTFHLLLNDAFNFQLKCIAFLIPKWASLPRSLPSTLIFHSDVQFPKEKQNIPV